MKNIETTGSYKAPNGQDTSYSYSYPSFDSLQDAVANLGEAEVLKLTQRMVKVDANNTTREKAKVANGHSSRAPQTEEQKAQAKAKRQADKAILDLLKAKGITSIEEALGLLG